MLRDGGIATKTQIVALCGVFALVVITPFGREASQPIVLGIYRSLLLLTTAAALISAHPDPKFTICPRFLSAIGLALGLMALSVMFESGSHFEGVYIFYQTALFIVAFIALAHFQRTQPTHRKHAVVLAVVAINAAFVAVALFNGKRPLIGPFVNPNYFASFLLPGIAVCLAGVALASKTRYRLAALAVAAFLYYGILQTSSRGATLAAVVMLGVALLKAIRRQRWKAAPLLLVALALGGMTVLVSPALIQKFLDRGDRDPYNYQRPQIWLSALKIIAAHPFLGVGPGRYVYVSKLFTPPVEGAIARYRKWPNIAHSEYLQYAAEIGIPAFLLLFGIGSFLLRSLWKRSQQSGAETKVIDESALLAAVGLAAHALVDNNWTVPVLAAGLAVVSQADSLPYRLKTVSLKPETSSYCIFPRRTVLAILCAIIFVQSTLIPTFALYFNESGHEAYVAEKFERAELMHQMAVGVAPDHPVLLDNLGMVYLDEFMKTHEPSLLNQAETSFRAAIAANPNFDVPAGHLETALIQRLSGDIVKDQPIHAKIIDADLRVLAANPFNPFIRKNLAEALYNTGRREQAVVELKRAIALEPNYVPGYLRLAEWCTETGNVSEGETYHKKALELAARYQGAPLTDSFDALLLGRPEPKGTAQ